MTFNLIQTLTTSIYSVKHIKITTTHIIFKIPFFWGGKTYLPQKQVQNKSAFYADLYSIIYIC